MRFPITYLLLTGLLLLGSCDALVSPAEPKKQEDNKNGPPVELFNTIDTTPDWSPDGKTIAYTHRPQNDEDRELGKGLQIWLLDLETKERRFLTMGWRPDWSPGSDKIVFSRREKTKEGLPKEISVLSLEDSSIRRLTKNSLSDGNPVWSSEGILWESYSGDYPDESGIWQMNADGSNKRQLTNQGGRMSWSPDGKRIVYYQEYDEENGTLWLMNADGSNKHPLTKPDDYAPMLQQLL